MRRCAVSIISNAVVYGDMRARNGRQWADPTAVEINKAALERDSEGWKTARGRWLYINCIHPLVFRCDPPDMAVVG
jgi:hypothetical protein